MKTMEALISTKESVEDEFLKKENVTGVSIGIKKTGGVDTGELAIIVYVAEKKDAKSLSKEELIPKRVGDIKTDVVQRTFVLHPLMAKVQDKKLQVDPTRYDSITGGISIGPCRSVHLEPPEVEAPGDYVFTGTLGAVVKDNASGENMLLSNFHVMCIDDQWKVGDQMSQQSLVDGGTCPADVVGELQRAALTESVDCAISSYTADRPISCEIKEIGDVTGIADTAIDMAVRKRGRTTGLTYGRVVSTTLTVKINYGDGLGVRLLRNQIDIEPDKSKNDMFGDHGDSGSVVVNDKSQVIGLHFAGDNTGSGVANPIKAVMEALNIAICIKSAEPDRCKKYEPYLMNVLLLAYRKPRLHACLCHYVCGVGDKPRCSILETAITKRVIKSLNLCPHLKENFCRRLLCSAGIAGFMDLGTAATPEEEMAQAELELAALEMEEPYIEKMTMGELGTIPEELELAGFSALDEAMFDSEIEFAATEALQQCQNVVPYLQSVIAAAAADPRMKRCLCHFICRIGPRPLCAPAHIEVVRRVAKILKICPQYRAPFCRGLRCA